MWLPVKSVLLIAAFSAMTLEAVAAPPSSLIPDAKTATAVARAILIPIYGAQAIQKEEPLVAVRSGDIWTVTGTLACAPRCVGGTAKVTLSAKDGRIISVIHTK